MNFVGKEGGPSAWPGLYTAGTLLGRDPVRVTVRASEKIWARA